MTRIRLTEAEVRLSKWLGRARHEFDVSKGMKEHIVGEDSIEQNIDGVAGELAVARHLNVYPDLTHDQSIFQHGAPDLIWDGFKVDVKATRYRHGRLLALPKSKAYDIDIYVLVVRLTESSFEIKGFAFDHEMFEDENLTTLRNGRPTYALPHGRLRPLGTTMRQHA